MAKKQKFVHKGICLPLVFIAITLTCIGLVMVLSASYNSTILSSNNASILDDVKFQAVVAVVGIIAMFIISRMDYHFLAKPKVLLSGFVISIILLLAVFAFEPTYDSHRWIRLSAFTFQPSEIAKFMAIIYVAYYTSKKKWWYRTGKDWLGLLIPVAILAGLIIIEPDLSTTLTLLGAVVMVMFVSGMQWKFLAGGIIGIAALIPLMISITGYQGRRFNAWLNAWADPKDVGYQVVQSLYAIGDGGLFGVGLGNSKQKITHLPMSDTDYIFSIICEEFGFVGAILVVALYVSYAFFGIKIAMEADDSFGAYLAVGVTCLVVLQAFINMGVATNVLPSTGITLPFISRGATSLGIVLCATGVLLSISARKLRKPKQSND
ncbi:MAG: cell division protein FtsW [Clostridiales bacterium]|nr:cell division protein FtsW [Clostridiales bacterium]